MLSYTFLAVFAVLVFPANTQGPIGTCSTENIATFVNALPNGTQCLSALQTVLANPVNESLNRLCDVNCGKVVAEYFITNCGNFGAGLDLTLGCYPSTNGYCRRFLPGFLNVTFLSNLMPCLSFDPTTPTCPQSCNAALTTFATEVACCYQFLFNNSDSLNYYRESQLVTRTQSFILGNITNPALWSACTENLVPICPNSDPFPGRRGLAAGTCTLTKLNDFISSLPTSCQESIETVRDPAVLFTNDGSAAFARVCHQDCAGAIVEYEEKTCEDQVRSTYSTLFCHKTEGELGQFCRQTFRRPDFFDGDIFSAAVASCIPFDSARGSCSTGCKDALQDLSSQLGCCYQTLYNDTTLLNLYLLNDQITFQQKIYFQEIGYRALWDACRVPLVAACTGDPFSGAIKFAASAVVVVLVSFFSAILY